MLRTYLKSTSAILFTVIFAFRGHSQCITTNIDSLIQANITWNSPHYPTGNLVVDSNKTLIIRSDVFMRQGAVITVKPGGRLKIYGGTITRKCSGTMWAGIRLDGHKERLQFSSGNIDPGQGLLITDSNAHIEWAVTGVQIKNGAIYQGTSTTFLNCRKCLEIMQYINPSFPSLNQTFLTDCDLICNDTLPGYNGTPTRQFISILEERGLIFRGLKIMDTTEMSKINDVIIVKYGIDHLDNGKLDSTIIHHGKDLGYGIVAINAGFKLAKSGPFTTNSQGCDIATGRRSFFKDLSYGIQHETIFPQYSINIEETDFINMQNFAMECIGNYYTDIRESHFIYDSGYKYNPMWGYGQRTTISFRNCKGFNIDSNQFISKTEFASTRFISITNSGPYYCYIQKNNFTFLNTLIDYPKISIIYELKNPNLQIRYNTFSSINSYDIFQSSSSNCSGVDSNSICDQGDVNTPALNSFSVNCLENAFLASNNIYYFATEDEITNWQSCTHTKIHLMQSEGIRPPYNCFLDPINP